LRLLQNWETEPVEFVEAEETPRKLLLLTQESERALYSRTVGVFVCAVAHSRFVGNSAAASAPPCVSRPTLQRVQQALGSEPAVPLTKKEKEEAEALLAVACFTKSKFREEDQPGAAATCARHNAEASAAYHRATPQVVAPEVRIHSLAIHSLAIAATLF
jgi:hypothetical protein